MNACYYMCILSSLLILILVDSLLLTFIQCCDEFCGVLFSPHCIFNVYLYDILNLSHLLNGLGDTYMCCVCVCLHVQVLYLYMSK